MKVEKSAIAQEAINNLERAGYGNQVDLVNEFSYGNEQANFLGMKRTGVAMNLRATNCTNSIQRFAVCPSMVKGLHIVDQTAANKVLGNGIVPFFLAPKPDVNPEEAFYIESLDSDQDLELIAGEAVHVPFHIPVISMRSYSVDSGQGESGNFGNVIQHFHKTPWKGDKPATKLSLAKFHKKTDFHLVMDDIDFVKENFPSFVSMNDILVFQVNPGTYIDFTVQIGARDSRAEYLNRKTKNATRFISGLIQ